MTHIAAPEQRGRAGKTGGLRVSGMCAVPARNLLRNKRVVVAYPQLRNTRQPRVRTRRWKWAWLRRWRERQVKRGARMPVPTSRLTPRMQVRMLTHRAISRACGRATRNQGKHSEEAAEAAEEARAEHDAVVVVRGRKQVCRGAGAGQRQRQKPRR